MTSLPLHSPSNDLPERKKTKHQWLRIPTNLQCSSVSDFIRKFESWSGFKYSTRTESLCIINIRILLGISRGKAREKKVICIVGNGHQVGLIINHCYMVFDRRSSNFAQLSCVLSSREMSGVHLQLTSRRDAILAAAAMAPLGTLNYSFFICPVILGRPRSFLCWWVFLWHRQQGNKKTEGQQRWDEFDGIQSNSIHLGLVDRK